MPPMEDPTVTVRIVVEGPEPEYLWGLPVKQVEGTTLEEAIAKTVGIAETLRGGSVRVDYDCPIHRDAGCGPAEEAEGKPSYTRDLEARCAAAEAKIAEFRVRLDKQRAQIVRLTAELERTMDTMQRVREAKRELDDLLS
jgi:uncharacterized coiled-coil protein SlyX